MRNLLSVLLLCSVVLLPAAVQAGKDYDKALKKAAEVVIELGVKVPEETRTKAQCVSVLTIGKGGFIFGGTGGRGFLTCKLKDQGTWSAPVVLEVGGGSAGFQIGGAKVELIMVFTKVEDIEDIAKTTPVFSGKASATAGDKGTGISGGGDPAVKGGVMTVSRSEGLYAGAVGEALVINPDEEESAVLLGSTRSLQDVLLKGAVAVPSEAKDFIAAVTSWQSEK